MTSEQIAEARALIEPLTGYTAGGWKARPAKSMEMYGRLYAVLNPERIPAAFVPAWDRPREGEVDGTEEAKSHTRLIAAAPAMRDTIAALLDHIDTQAEQSDYWEASSNAAWAEVEKLRGSLEYVERQAEELRALVRQRETALEARPFKELGAGILSRLREIEALRTDNARLTREVAALSKRLAKTADEARRLTAANDALRDEKKLLAFDCNRLRATLAYRGRGYEQDTSAGQQ